MCDCYDHKCAHPQCTQLMPIHIGDFCTPRENLEVVCTRHLPKDFDGAIWRWYRPGEFSGEDLPRGFKMGIRILDKSQVREWGQGWEHYKDQIHPNSVSAEKIQDWTEKEV